MKNSSIIGIIVGGILGVVSYIVKKSYDEGKELNLDTLLQEYFGEPMVTSKLSFVEVKKWAKRHEDLLQDGSKMMVMKVKQELFDNASIPLAVGSNPNKYLVMLILDANNSTEYKKQLLIKYESLDEGLEQLLGKDGVVIIEM